MIHALTQVLPNRSLGRDFPDHRHALNAIVSCKRASGKNPESLNRGMLYFNCIHSIKQFVHPNIELACYASF